ncbi:MULTISPECIES: hypothetical protein [Massilia]|uniref:hypothetical protein n=1 Tax=Massilia TaxID=149698 RepID=UPI000A66B171|nr:MULTISPECIES: hypothetical protein [Massilia]
MFYAYQSSYSSEQIDVLRELFDQPSINIFSFVEIPFNGQIFHVDVAPVSMESRWQRFIFDSIEKVFLFAQSENIKFYKISLQSRRVDERDYKIRSVKRVFVGNSPDGNIVHVFELSDGAMEHNALDEVDKDNLRKVSLVWAEPDFKI